MWSRPQLTPKQLAAIALSGALLFIATALAAELRVWTTHQPFLSDLHVGHGGWFSRFVQKSIPGERQWMDWAQVKPLVSDHWGQKTS